MTFQDFEKKLKTDESAAFVKVIFTSEGLSELELSGYAPSMLVGINFLLDEIAKESKTSFVDVLTELAKIHVQVKREEIIQEGNEDGICRNFNDNFYRS